MASGNLDEGVETVSRPLRLARAEDKAVEWFLMNSNDADAKYQSVGYSQLTQANLSYAVAAIPGQPFKEQIASASLAISRRFENANIIDNERFPAHLSLFLGGTDSEFVGPLVDRLSQAVPSLLKTRIRAESLYKGSRGFLGVVCARSSELQVLVEGITALCTAHHNSHPRYRPHLIERWPKLSTERQELVKTYGTYKTWAFFEPHFSVAEVANEAIDESLRIAEEYLLLPQDSTVEAIQLVDIGHRNEKWVVLKEWN